MRFVVAKEEAHWEKARGLVLEYASALDFDLDFQGFKAEVESLADEYGDPKGCFLLAEEEGAFVGCVGLRALSDETCELKRLFVAPSKRGMKLGFFLVEGIVEQARKRGFFRMRLDTVPGMDTAIGIYGIMGFKLIDPYRHNPIEGATYMELVL